MRQGRRRGGWGFAAFTLAAGCDTIPHAVDRGSPQQEETPVGKAAPRFRHVTIDPEPPGGEHDVTLLHDLTGNGLPDAIIGSKRGEFNLMWYENPGWARHDMASAPNLEAGGVVVDVNGDGRPDVVVGQQWGGHELYWFECPADPREPWTKHIIENRFEKYHDQAVGDIDGDGEPELVAVSQRSGVLVYYDIPPDPTVSPWPASCCHAIAEGIDEIEGLAIVDIDGDGQTELIAGPSVFRRAADGTWSARCFAPDYVKTRVGVADLDGDGRLEMVLAEGESHPGRLAVCSAPDWTPRVLCDDLFHPHSLEVADFTGDGLPDIFVGEMGLGRNAEPRLILFVNQGGGRFEPTTLSRGIPTHEAKAADMTGNGRPDIVGKSYDPERHIDIWYNEG